MYIRIYIKIYTHSFKKRLLLKRPPIHIPSKSMPTRHCSFCGKLTQCKHCPCNQAVYCGSECQAAHWPWHKLSCTAPTDTFQVGFCSWCDTYKRCRRCPCKAVLYCNRECQASDWGDHQLVCRRVTWAKKGQGKGLQGESEGQVEDLY